MSSTVDQSLPYKPPSRQFFERSAILGTIFTAIVGLFAVLDVNPLVVFTEAHYAWDLTKEMMPPKLSLLWESNGLYDSIGETISAAFLGTVFGGTFALVLSFLAAQNTAPSKWARSVMRTIFSVERAIPEFATLLVIIAVVGVGPFTSTLALTIASIGFCGRLCADAIENIDRKPIEGLDVVGSTQLQTIRYGVLPQVAPSFLSTLFYMFDVNLRRAIVLGYFGGGGLGFELERSKGMLQYKDMLAYTLCIIVLVMLMERVSDFVRRRIINVDTQLK
ncbi:MAG: phosphonate ABC transporter, permease protein PhnE [Verrucomicrobiota bacterium]